MPRRLRDSPTTRRQAPAATGPGSRAQRALCGLGSWEPGPGARRGWAGPSPSSGHSEGSRPGPGLGCRGPLSSPRPAALPRRARPERGPTAPSGRPAGPVPKVPRSAPALGSPSAPRGPGLRTPGVTCGPPLPFSELSAAPGGSGRGGPGLSRALRSRRVRSGSSAALRRPNAALHAPPLPTVRPAGLQTEVRFWESLYKSRFRGLVTVVPFCSSGMEPGNSNFYQF